MKYIYFLLLAAFVYLITGCSGMRAPSTTTTVPQPVPTLNPLFAKPDVNLSMTNLSTFLQESPVTNTLTLGEIATITPTLNIDALTTPEVSSTPLTVTPEPTPTPEPTRTITDTVYNGKLDPNWTIQPDSALPYQLQNVFHSFQGDPSIALTPKQAGGNLFFQVRQNTTTPYLHNQVIGVSFWLNTGNNTLSPGDISLTVVGSNDNPYYIYNDRSADNQPLMTKSGTRTYDLGLNHSVPPNTWILFETDLDSLVFDPGYQPTPVVDTDYKYLTGFYLTIENGSLKTFYITQVGLLVVKP